MDHANEKEREWAQELAAAKREAIRKGLEEKEASLRRGKLRWKE
jgi:hypothetical protein